MHRPDEVSGVVFSITSNHAAGGHHSVTHSFQTI